MENIVAFYAGLFVSVVGYSGRIYAIMGGTFTGALEPCLFKEHKIPKMMFTKVLYRA